MSYAASGGLEEFLSWHLFPFLETVWLKVCIIKSCSESAYRPQILACFPNRLLLQFCPSKWSIYTIILTRIQKHFPLLSLCWSVLGRSAPSFTFSFLFCVMTFALFLISSRSTELRCGSVSETIISKSHYIWSQTCLIFFFLNAIFSTHVWIMPYCLLKNFKKHWEQGFNFCASLQGKGLL